MRFKRILALILCIVLVSTVLGYADGSMRNTYAAVSQSRRTADVGEFPASYQSGLSAVRKAFPNAKLIYFDTGLEWSELFTEKSFYYPYRCSIPNSKRTDGSYTYPSSYKGIEFNNAFDFLRNDWVEQEGGWTQASEALIQYYVDPRNWFSVQGIFSFLSASYNESLDTVDTINAALKNTFMYYDYETENGTTLTVPAKYTDFSVSVDGTVSENAEEYETVEMTYAEVFCLLGENLGVSALALANRVRNEQGVNGTSPLISGTYTGFEGYYNYFNMGATGSTNEEIYRNGLTEAKKAGWDSPYKALLGGAAKYTARYVSNGRNTPYLLKYNVVANSSGVVNYLPYMTAVFSPESEAKNSYNTFSNLGLIHAADENGVVSEAAFEFIIPVYRNMPDDVCLKPTGDGNPNYKLSGLAVNNGAYSLGTFDVDTLSYSTVVPYEAESVTLQASVFSTTTSVSIAGVEKGSGRTDFAQEVPLQVGNNSFYIVATAENGLTRTYSVTLFRQEREGYSFEFKGVRADETTMRVTGLTQGETVQTFLDTHVKVENASLRMLGLNGQECENTELIATGQKLQIIYQDEIVSEYVLVLRGDLNCDGLIGIMDVVKFKRHFLHIERLSGLSEVSGDLNSDGQINILDYVVIKRHILKIENVPQ